MICARAAQTVRRRQDAGSATRPDARTMIQRPRKLLLALCLVALGSPPAAQAALYRWVDEEGVVHYTDTLPPSQKDRGHTVINEEGIRMRTVPPAKTAEEVERDREMERLRTQQERLVEQQRAADRLLLRTFRTEDDILMARDGKIATLDVMVQVTRNNIRRQQEWLAGLRAEAANLERAGKPVTQRLRDGISKTERSIADGYETIVEREQQKEAIRENFERDLTRFRQLQDLPEGESAHGARQERPVLHNIVVCADAAECNRLWPAAVAYARTHATTTIQSEGENILITAPPATDEDISLILSRINDKKGPGASLFLDVQCRATSRGDRTCQSAEARRVLEHFREAVLGPATGS